MAVVEARGGASTRAGEFGLDGFVFFEIGEDILGATDDGIGHACKAGDMDAVALVCSAWDNASEEDNGVALFTDLHGVVADAGEGGGEGGEFVIVGGEEGACFAFWGVVEIFDNAPGDGDAIKG